MEVKCLILGYGLRECDEVESFLSLFQMPRFLCKKLLGSRGFSEPEEPLGHSKQCEENVIG